MAKNLVDGTNIIIEENGDNINMNLSSAYNAALLAQINAALENYFKCDILWTNPNPTSSFAEQTITLSSGNYDFYEIYCVYSNTSGSHYANGFKTIKGKGIIISENGYGTDLSIRRKVDYTNATHLLISSAYAGANIDNNYLVPIYVIGYKTGTFN